MTINPIFNVIFLLVIKPIKIRVESENNSRISERKRLFGDRQATCTKKESWEQIWRPIEVGD